MWDYSLRLECLDRCLVHFVRVLIALDINQIDKLVFKRSSGCVSTVLDGETVILAIESGLYSGLNEVGTVLWDAMEDFVTFATMREAVVAGFDIAQDRCSEDVFSFLKELAENKLIEVSVGKNT